MEKLTDNETARQLAEILRKVGSSGVTVYELRRRAALIVQQLKQRRLGLYREPDEAARKAFNEADW